MAGIVKRIYRSETDFDLIGARRRWYLASGILLLVCLVSFAVRGFNLGIEFAGGDQFQFPAANIQTTQASAAVQGTGTQVASTQVVGAGGNRSIVIRTAQLSPIQEAKVRTALASRLGTKESDISTNAVSSSWGSDVTHKALIGLVVFLVLVCILIGTLFELRMAIAAIAALAHDVILAAGVYSLVGFEVTPSTVVGLLTILGYSLYDTVVVFDKVKENTRGILGAGRMTYSEAANLAVNQTLARSINTSLMALLPVAGLLFVGAGLLGVGTLKDLALVLFVGLASGAYSSLFLATPILADLKEREPQFAALRKRVGAKRAALVARPAPVPAGAARRAGQPGRATAGPASDADPDLVPDDEPAAAAQARPVPAAAGAPRPGTRPKRPPQQQRRGGGGRPSSKRRK